MMLADVLINKRNLSNWMKKSLIWFGFYLKGLFDIESYEWNPFKDMIKLKAPEIYLG